MNIITSPYLSIFISALAPLASFSALNQQYYSTRQLVFSFLISIIFLAIASSCLYPLFTFLENLNFLDNRISLVNMLACTISLILFFIFYERGFTEVINDKKLNKKLKFALFLFFIPISSLFSLLVLNSILMIFLLSSISDAWKRRHVEKEILFDSNGDNTYYSSSNKTGITLKDKPNIYYLLLESYQGADALKEFYDLDQTDLDIFLEENNFTDYKKIFSNRPNTPTSVNSLFNCQLNYSVEHRNALNLDILRENGYTCEFYDNSGYVFAKYLMENEFSNFNLSRTNKLLYNYFGPLFGTSKYLRIFVSDIDTFDTTICFENLFNTFKKRISLKQKSPRFYALRFGAEHSNPFADWERNSEFMTIYPARIKTAEGQVKTVVNTILENDPNALIIALGDHGPLCHINIMQKSKHNLQETLKEKNVSNTEYANDMFSIRCAIRWTQPHKTMDKVISPLNIFPYIFDSLGANTSLDHIQDNISINLENDVIVKEGKVLDTVISFKEFYLNKYDHNKNTYQELTFEECILLINYLDFAERAPLLEFAIEKFGYCAELQEIYILSLHKSNKIKKALDEAEKIIQSSTYTDNFLKYYAYILSLANPDKLLELYAKNTFKLDDFRFNLNVARAYKKTNSNLLFKDITSGFIENYIFPTIYYFKDIVCLHLYDSKNEEIQKYYNLIPVFSKKHIAYLNDAYLISLAYQKKWNILNNIVKDSNDLLNNKHFSKNNLYPWTFFFIIYAKQKLALIDKALEILFAFEKKNKELTCVKERIGQIALKQNKNEDLYEPYKKIAFDYKEKVDLFFKNNFQIDKEWYISEAKKLGIELTHDDNLAWHYVSEGIYEGLNPALWFNSFQYFLLYPSVIRSGKNPFIHFLEEGIDKLESPAFEYNIEEIYYENNDKEFTKEELIQEMNRKWK